jgi:hypothetical protein
MFTMMNYERLSMGSQGLGAAERAYQNALSYAKERLQGRIAEKDANKAESIIGHADVRRMLLNIKAINEAGRTFATWVASLLDKAKYDDCQVSAQRANLLTPITKAFMTDQGFEACVTAQQVFGGHGYVKEWGMEQLVRDVRIAQIYEGTNGIQAADFMLRKVAADNGQVLIALFNDIKAEMLATPITAAAVMPHYIDELLSLTSALLQQDFRAKSANACDFLAAVSYVLYGYMWYKNLVALQHADVSECFEQSKKNTAAYYFSRILPKAKGLFALLSEDTSSIDSLSTEQF